MSLINQLADRALGGRLTRRDFQDRFDRYLKDGQHLDGDGESLLAAFLKSGGEWLTDAADRAAEVRPTYDFAEAEDVLGLWREEGSYDRALGSLRRDGYAILDVRIPDHMVEQLRDSFATAPCTLTSDMESTGSGGLVDHVDFDAPVAEKYAVTTDATLQTPLVRSLLLDRGLLQIAQGYCGSAPIVDIVIAWYSFPVGRASHQAGQLFHFDLDRVRWLKAFLLLSDQDVETGAHMYVPGTQADHGIRPELLAKGYARLEDEDVTRYYPRDSWKTMEGRSGVILLEDTRGLHKGLPLVRDHRLMLQFEYAQSMFGHVPHLATCPLQPIEDPYWEHMRQLYPQVFSVMDRPRG